MSMKKILLSVFLLMLPNLMHQEQVIGQQTIDKELNENQIHEQIQKIERQQAVNNNMKKGESFDQGFRSDIKKQHSHQNKLDNSQKNQRLQSKQSRSQSVTNQQNNIPKQQEIQFQQLIFTNSQNQQTEIHNQQTTSQQSSSHYHQWHDMQFWRNALLSAFLCCVGGFCSGLTVGLMSIQTIQLQIMSLSQDQQEKKVAHRILSVVSNHHLFLVTLLLANAIALESLPLVVHTLMPAWAAILFSTFIVLIVAQIVPQAFCTGPKKITIAYHAAPVILAMQKIFWILAYPMAKGLDYLLGQHHHHRIQHKDFANFLTGGSQNMNNTQKLLLTSILQLRAKRVPHIMIPLSQLYMLSLTQKLTSAKIKQIHKRDYSYIVVYKDTRSNVVGVIKTKQFAIKYLKSQKKNLTVQDLFVERQDILCVYQDTNLLEMLMIFQARKQRLSIVIGKKRKIQPGIQSIMYSKSDMIANNQQGEVLGVVILYKIFEAVTEHDAQVANVLNMGNLLNNPDKSVHKQKQMQMKDINKPLIPK